MLHIILVLAILGYCYYLYRSRYKNGDYIFTGIMISLFLSIIILVIANSTSVFKESCREGHSIEIVSLSNSQSVSGSFFLGSGIINSTEYYFSFVRNSDGSFSRWKTPTYNAKLYLTNNKKPQIIWDRICYRAPSWLTYITCNQYQNSSYDIYVPENTIIQKFEVK